MAGIYIHIPFCRSKCYYCDFYSVSRKDLYSRFTDTVIEEWHSRKKDFPDFSTLYIGGGTPSSLPLDELKRLLELFRHKRFEEATIEANPDDVNVDLLELLTDSPINRISMGVQSAVTSELKSIGRRHDFEAAKKASSLISDYGFDLSLDLIYGLPGQTLDSWIYSIQSLLSLNPNHLSCYILSFEPGTRLELMRRKGEIFETSDTTLETYYRELCSRLSDAGFRHYEISNFAKEGHEAVHNSNYWNFTPYLGLGPGAHSFDGINRSFNPPSVQNYIKSGGKGFNIVEETLPHDRINDYIMIRLRTAAGLDIGDFSKRFGSENTEILLSQAKPLISQTLLNRSQSRIAIDESHWLISDSIISDLLF